MLMKIDMRKRMVLFILLLFTVFAAAASPADTTRCFQSQTITGNTVQTKKYIINTDDSIPNDTLYQNISEEGYPLSYFRKIQTEVCFDQKCRALNIILYWNITGRYLGFALPEEEFLSKTDHVPFKPEEYERLHEILADPLSPIAGFSYNQLLVKSPYKLGLDGITGATAPAIANHTVPGAVYTTYQLWHFVYGGIKQEVENLTVKTLTPKLILQILESKDESDKMWALNHINGFIKLNPPLENKLISLINNDNYNISERSIHAFPSVSLESEHLQLLLLKKFYEVNNSIKRLLADRFETIDKLHEKVVLKMASDLESMNANMQSLTLDIFKQQEVIDNAAQRQIAKLLKGDNTYIGKKAYELLKKCSSLDPAVQKLLMKTNF